MILRPFLLMICLLAACQNADAQIKIRKVAATGDVIPGTPNGTFDNVNIAGARAIVLDLGTVVFYSPRRINNFSSGSVAASWNGFDPNVILSTNDDPPPLPATFRNSRDDAHVEPKIVNPSFGLLVGSSISWYLNTRIGDVGVPGSVRAFLTGVANFPGFHSEGGSDVRGVATTTGSLILVHVGTPNFIGNKSFSGEVVQLLVEGEQAPDLSFGVVVDNVVSSALKWSPLGKITFKGNVSGTGIDASNNEVLYREIHNFQEVLLIAQTGTPHPSAAGLSTNGQFVNLGFNGALGFSSNNANETAFEANITDPALPASTVGSIWRAAQDFSLTFIVRVGEALTIPGAGAVTFSSLGSPLLTSQGDIIFSGLWNDGSFRQGLFRWVKATGVIQAEIVLGNPVEGAITGLVLESVGSYLVSSSGRIAARARVRKLNATIRQGIIAQRDNGAFYALALENENLELTGGAFLGIVDTARFPTFTESSNSEDGAPSAFSGFGRLAFHVTGTTTAENITTTTEYLLAADIDPRSLRPRSGFAAPGGGTRMWSYPDMFDTALQREIDRTQLDLTTASTLQEPFDLNLLVDLSDFEISLLRLGGIFAGDASIFANEYLKARINVLNTIELIERYNPALASWLLDSFRTGRIMFDSDSGSDSFAEIAADGSAFCGQEPITLRFIPTGDLSIYHPDFFQLANTLMHEAQHAFQAFPALNGIHTALEQAEWARDRHDREIEASCEELLRISDLQRALNGLEASAAAQSIVFALNNDNELSGAARDAARDALEARLRKMRRNAQETKSCRETYVEALNRFIASPGTAADIEAMHKQLAQVHWFKQFRKTNTEFGEIVVTGGGGTFNSGSGNYDGDPELRQLDTEANTETRFDTGVSAEYLYHGILNIDGDKLYVAVKEGGEGRIYSYEDIDADFIFDESTRTFVAGDPALKDGTLLAIDPSNKKLYALDTLNKQIFVVGDNVATAWGSFATPNPVQFFEVENGVATASPIAEEEVLTADVVTAVTAEDPEGVVSNQDPYLRYAARALAAVFEKAPVEGDTVVHVAGQPGMPYQLFRGATSNMLSLAGDGVVGTNGRATISIAPLFLGEDIQLRMPGDDRRSFRQPVWDPSDLILQTRLIIVDESTGIWSETIGLPMGRYANSTSFDLKTWVPDEPYQQGGYGTHWTQTIPPLNSTAGFLRTEEAP